MTSTSGKEATYEVRVRERLDESWSTRLNGVAMAFEGEANGPGATILTGSLDQAGLRGLLTRLWDLNLTVVSVASLAPTRDLRPVAMSTSSSQECGADPGDVQSLPDSGHA